jgi:hypothetical protein
MGITDKPSQAPFRFVIVHPVGRVDRRMVRHQTDHLCRLGQVELKYLIIKSWVSSQTLLPPGM